MPNLNQQKKIKQIITAAYFNNCVNFLKNCTETEPIEKTTFFWSTTFANKSTENHCYLEPSGHLMM